MKKMKKIHLLIFLILIAYTCKANAYIIDSNTHRINIDLNRFVIKRLLPISIKSKIIVNNRLHFSSIKTDNRKYGVVGSRLHLR